MLYYLIELALIGLRPSSPPALEQGRARGIPRAQGFEMFQCDKDIKIQIFSNVLDSKNFKSLKMFSDTGMIIFTFETE